MRTFSYTPHGVCSRQMDFELEGDTITSLRIQNGCPGNLQGISRLLEGMDIHDTIAKLRGIRCGFKSTSCPDQIAQALEKYLAAP